MPPTEVITPELATSLVEISRELRRQAGVVIDRRGRVHSVAVGSATGLELDWLGASNPGSGRLSGLRLIHTHLKGEPLGQDDYHALTFLSLDLIGALDASPNRNPITLTAAHITPPNDPSGPWNTLPTCSIHSIPTDFGALAEDLDARFTRALRLARPEGASGPDRAMLVFVDDGRYENPDWECEELRELALSAGLQVVDLVLQKRRIDVTWFMGKGRLFDMLISAHQKQVDLIVLCPEISPAQMRNIGEVANVRVIDRTQLILDIFAQRAKSSDGRIQVELAQLRYLLPRLLGAGRALSRLAGGIGARGPGESKLEMDRRKVRLRIATLEKRLELAADRRRERRKRRERTEVPIVAIVGYTNAGKSTLLNTLTKANAVAENRLFATLDPFSKRLRFPQDREIILTDTVGFIRDLPRDLKAAFRATLEELEAADLLLHVVDASNRRGEEQLLAVEQLLVELELAHVPRLTVFNKIDRVEDPVAALNLAQRYGGLAVSALSRESLRPLVQQMETWLWQPQADVDVGLESETGELE